MHTITSTADANRHVRVGWNPTSNSVDLAIFSDGDHHPRAVIRLTQTATHDVIQALTESLSITETKT